MREIRQSGSEGGGAEPNRLSLPLYPRVVIRRPLRGLCAVLVALDPPAKSRRQEDLRPFGARRSENAEADCRFPSYPS
jgi:hypothetical protein